MNIIVSGHVACISCIVMVSDVMVYDIWLMKPF